MPFDKNTPTACEPRGHLTLLAAALFLLLALLSACLAIRAPVSEEATGPVGELMAREAVVAFLGLDGEE